MEIRIPAKFEKCLSAEPKWARRVEDLTGSVKDVLRQETAFFPEYTEHCLLHVNTVLAMAAELIPGRSIGKNTISPRDVACLIAAIVIHDLGMFLTPAGLDVLMSKQWDVHRSEKLDAQPWEDAWERYISATKRLPQEQMKRCFGKMIRVEKTTLVKDRMTWDDKLVIGEFLRQNHPRLAQEIAVAGMPGTQLQHFLADAGFEPDERSVIGLMARSHGMSLREVEAYLGPEAYLSNMPVYYLMAILRLADYLDASQERAPMIRVKQEDLGSPLSKEEWALNRCFRIDSSRWFPEKQHYTIAADPQTSSEYARLEKWLEHAQRELDLSWAALTEKYPDGRLKLSIHRIKCTMHEKLSHERICDRILPREVRVTANPEIVKLMIEPLYGDDPTYGVRELLQNAVDACVERKEWERRHGNPDYKGLVDIRIQGDIFTITDNGMGMNEEILLNYYLSAGSSYRSSEAWKAANAPDGESRVARTGKFGVGFLASFLLGDEIQVHTQHLKDKKGYQFRFDQRSMPLDVERKVRRNDYATQKEDPAGTTITIRLNEKGLKLKSSVHWRGWYVFDEPRVEYYMDGEQLYQTVLSLSRETERNDGWLELPTDAYEAYLWSPNMYQTGSDFYCNGIRIEGGLPADLARCGLRVRYPNVSVIDTRAALDVDLARRTLKSFPEEESLCREVLRWHIARLLLTPWDTERQCLLNLIEGFKLGEAAGGEWVPFLFSSGGYSLNCSSLITTLSAEKHVILYYAGCNVKGTVRTAEHFLAGNTPYSMVTAYSYRPEHRTYYRAGAFSCTSPVSFVSALLQGNDRLFNSSTTGYWEAECIASLWLLEGTREQLSRAQQDRFRMETAGVFDKIHAFRRKDQNAVMPIRRDRFSIEEFPVAFYLDIPKYFVDQNTLFAQIYREALTPAEGYAPDDYWIPFGMEKRRKKFPKAFEELKVYMDYLQEHPVE